MDQSDIRLLSTVDNAYRAMLEAIGQARNRVRLEMYIFAADPVGERFRDALVAAAGRGVQVQVMLDAFGSATLPNRFWDPLRDAGGCVRWFNPIRFQTFAFRNHRKSLTCDEAVAFVGGFNIAAAYEGDGLNRGWRDFGVRLRGPLVADIATSFDRLFERADRPCRRFARFARARSRGVFNASAGQLLLGAPGWGSNHLSAALTADIRRARDIRIVSAYLLPPRRMRRALCDAARAGRRVLLIVPGRSDVLISQLATRWLYRSLLRAGVEIFEYQPQILHAKLFVLDDIVCVGSANLNVRSLHIDFELLLRLPGRELAASARREFDDMLALSVQVDHDEWSSRRSPWMRLLERVAYLLLARLDPLIAGRQLRALR